jgi:hypothetical protein
MFTEVDSRNGDDWCHFALVMFDVNLGLSRKKACHLCSKNRINLDILIHIPYR